MIQGDSVCNLQEDKGRQESKDERAANKSSPGQKGVPYMKKSICRASAGFTLVELIVCLTIFVIVLVIASINYRNYKANLLCRQFAQTLVKELNDARDLAIQNALIDPNSTSTVAQQAIPLSDATDLVYAVRKGPIDTGQILRRGNVLGLKVPVVGNAYNLPTTIDPNLIHVDFYYGVSYFDTPTFSIPYDSAGRIAFPGAGVNEAFVFIFSKGDKTFRIEVNALSGRVTMTEQ